MFKAETLTQMGVRPPKTRRPMTVEEAAARNQKSLATPAARHTMGKRQKAKVKGVVPKG